MTGNFGKASKHHQYELMSCQYRSTDYWAGDTLGDLQYETTKFSPFGPVVSKLVWINLPFSTPCFAL